MGFRAFNGIKKIAPGHSADLVLSLCQTSGLYWRPAYLFNLLRCNLIFSDRS